MTLKVWLNGYNGRMGQEICEATESSEGLLIEGGSGHLYLKNQFQEKQDYSSEELAENLEKVDLIIDFSNVDGNASLLKAIHLTKSKKAILIGTTGLSKEIRSQWKKMCTEGGHSILFAPNTSLGVLLTMKLSQQMASILQPKGFDIEITESHHRRKVDAPSGTAKFLADRICDMVPLEIVTHREGARRESEIGVFALRGGSVFGEHEVRFMGDFEELSISHRALSRSLFAKGAIILGKWISDQEKGRHYGLTDVSLEDISS